MTTAEIALVVSIIGLAVTMGIHIFIIARWSGRVDARLEDILRQPSARAEDVATLGAALRAEFGGLSEEVKRLRDARHVADGKIQIHEGKFQAYDRLMGRLDSFMDDRGRDSLLERRKGT